MNRNDIDILEQKTNYQGYFKITSLCYRHKLFAGGWSARICREIFERGNSVAVLLYNPAKQQVALVEQCRAGVVPHTQSPWLLEIVAGQCEPGENSEQVAIREAQEEAGVTITEIVPICNYFVSPGGTSERMALYCAKLDDDNNAVEGIYGLQHENEDIKLRLLTCEQAFDDVNSGKINAGPTIIALQWLQLNKQHLWQENYDR